MKPGQKDKDDDREVSPGGSEIYRYKEHKKRGWTPPASYGKFADAVNERFEALFPGRETTVFHEIISDLVHIDVNVMKPGKDDDCYVIFTTGMSDLPMTLPDSIKERDDLKYAELFMFLPLSWHPGEAYAISTQLPYEDHWPIEAIKFLARFPHEYKTWLGTGHTIPNGQNYEPFLDGSEMSCFMLLDMGDDYKIEMEDGTVINTYMVAPITRAETEYKLEHGMSALIDKFAEQDVQLVIDMYRKSTV